MDVRVKEVFAPMAPRVISLKGIFSYSWAQASTIYSLRALVRSCDPLGIFASPVRDQRALFAQDAASPRTSRPLFQAAAGQCWRRLFSAPAMPLPPDVAKGMSVLPAKS